MFTDNVPWTSIDIDMPSLISLEKEYNIKNGVRIVIFKNGKRIMFDIIDEKYIQQWNQYFKGILSNSKNQ